MASYSVTLTPRPIYTELERCFKRIRPTSGKKILAIDDKKSLLLQLFTKSEIQNDSIKLTRTETLKYLSIKAIYFNISPTEEIEKRIYYINIKNIYLRLLQKNTEFEKEETSLIEEFLRCHYNETYLYQSIEEPEFPSVSCLQAQTLLSRHPIQWAFRVLDPQVLILGYKSFTSTETLFDEIYVALNDETFSPDQQELIHLRLIKILMTWLMERYFLDELSKESVLSRFQAILSVLDKVPNEKVRIEKKSLQVHFEESLTITPRNRRDSFSLSPIEDLISDLISAEKKKELAIKCDRFRAELTSYFVNLMVDIPVEEFFNQLDTMKMSPRLSNLTQRINALEAWLQSKFEEITSHKERARLHEAIICTMQISYLKKEYQTVFSLKVALDKTISKDKPLYLSTRAQNIYGVIEELFDVSHNLKNLMLEYKETASNKDKFMPVIGFMTKHLLPILNTTIVKRVNELEVYNLDRFKQIYQTLHPFFEFIKNSESYVPTTNLNYKIEATIPSGFVLAEFF